MPFCQSVAIDFNEDAMQPSLNGHFGINQYCFLKVLDVFEE